MAHRESPTGVEGGLGARGISVASDRVVRGDAITAAVAVGS